MSLFKRNKKEYEDIEPKEAFTVLEKNRHNSDFAVLDVRTPEEYNEGHVENALLLNIKSKDFEEELDKLNKDKNYFAALAIAATCSGEVPQHPPTNRAPASTHSAT